MRGRKPKPIELRILQGNPSHRPLPKNIPQPEKLYNIPEVPIYFDKDAKEIWNYLTPKLINCGILSDIDIYVLENCCFALSLMRRARKELTSSPLVIVNKNTKGKLKSKQRTPYLTVYREALELFDSSGARLGLSPADRIRLRGLDKITDKDDPLQDFLKNGKTKSG